MKLVAAVKMLPTKAQATCLKATLARCNEAATWLAALGFEASTFRQYDLHKLAYVELRERFGLTAQAAVRSISKVADAFKVNREVAPVFRADAAQPYDDRIIRFTKDGAGVPVAFVDPRNTSRQCTACGCIDKKNRKNQATFSCIACGHEAPADFNAAINIRSRALMAKADVAPPQVLAA